LIHSHHHKSSPTAEYLTAFSSIISSSLFVEPYIMVATSQLARLERLSSVRGDTMSTSFMDHSGLRPNKNCGSIKTWKKVTVSVLDDIHADSPFFASSPSRPLPFFGVKGERKSRSMFGELLSEASRNRS
jgi:hypothetical protein